jgi:hypothetical protein
MKKAILLAKVQQQLLDSKALHAEQTPKFYKNQFFLIQT